MRSSDGTEKIGISTNSKRRRKQIDDSLENESVKLLFEIKLFNAQQIEKRLHNDYSNQWKPKFKGSGRLEFFDLNFLNVAVIKWRLRKIYLIQRIKILLSIILTVFIFSFFV